MVLGAVMGGGRGRGGWSDEEMGERVCVCVLGLSGWVGGWVCGERTDEALEAGQGDVLTMVLVGLGEGVGRG